MNLIQEIIGEMGRDELNITLALIHKRMCELHGADCRTCPWNGSWLCLPVRRYLRSEMEDDE